MAAASDVESAVAAYFQVLERMAQACEAGTLECSGVTERLGFVTVERWQQWMSGEDVRH